MPLPSVIDREVAGVIIPLFSLIVLEVSPLVLERDRAAEESAGNPIVQRGMEGVLISHNRIYWHSPLAYSNIK